MTVKRGLRRRCDLLACGKQYRYAKASSKTCSPACRQALYLQRKQIRQEQVETELHGKYARMYARMVEQTAERERQDESNRQAAPAPRPRTATPPPAETDWPWEHISRPEPKPQTVIIRYRKPYVTPI